LRKIVNLEIVTTLLLLLLCDWDLPMTSKVTFLEFQRYQTAVAQRRSKPSIPTPLAKGAEP
jgi:hypothetical protein